MSDATHRQDSVHNSDDRRIIAIQFVLLGSIRHTAETADIPVRTPCDWQKTDWWEILIAQVHTEMERKIDATLSEMIQLALAVTTGRLKNGDYVITVKGEVVCEPVSTRDVMVILAVAIDK